MNTKPRNYVQKNLHKFCKPSIIPNKKKCESPLKVHIDKLNLIEEYYRRHGLEDNIGNYFKAMDKLEREGTLE